MLHFFSIFDLIFNHHFIYLFAYPFIFFHFVKHCYFEPFELFPISITTNEIPVKYFTSHILKRFFHFYNLHFLGYWDTVPSGKYLKIIKMFLQQYYVLYLINFLKHFSLTFNVWRQHFIHTQHSMNLFLQLQQLISMYVQKLTCAYERFYVYVHHSELGCWVYCEWRWRRVETAH